MKKTNPRYGATGAGVTGGFALIVSLALMTFILLLIMSLSTLVRLESQVGTMQVAQSRAQQNALLGLRIAIGQLQALAGPDQRVTATANIDDALSEASHAHWTGVWDVAGRDPYDPYASPSQMGWLVSGLNGSDNALEPGDNVADPVILVGDNSVANADDQVEVGKIAIEGDNPSTSGHYAYWVSDEGVKAKLTLRDEHRDADSGDATEKRYSLMSAQRNGIESVSLRESGSGQKLSDVIDPLNATVASNLERLSSVNQLDIMDSALEELRKHRYHDVTTDGFGLLTNTASGGLRKDLTLAFEMDLDDFNAADLFAAGGETVPNLTAHRVNYLFEFDEFNEPAPVATDAMARGPTWHLLRNFYRLYKPDDPDRYESHKRGNPAGVQSSGSGYTIAARPYFPTSGSQSLAAGRVGDERITGGYSYTGSDPLVRAQFTDASTDKDLGRETDMPITPIVLREQIFLSLVADEVTPAATGGEEGTQATRTFELKMRLCPVVTIWNPYNVRLSFEKLFVNIVNTKINSSIGVEGTEYSMGNMLKGYSIRLELTANGGGSTTLEPGEMEVYAMSGNVTFASNDVNATCHPYSGSQAQLPGIVFNHLDGSAVLEASEDDSIKITGGAESYMMSFIWLGRTINGSQVDNLVQSGWLNVFDDDSLHWPSQGQTVTLAELDASGLLTQPVPVAMLDCYLKPVSDNDPVMFLAQFNPRATQYRRATGTKGFFTGEGGPNPENWEFKFRSLASNNTSALTTTGYWGDDNASGATNVVLFEIPTLPMQSLAGFQHVNNVTHYAQNPASPIGNSYANPFIGRTAVSRTISATYQGKTSHYTQLDWSYLCNQALWDEYFFSTLTPRTDLNMDDGDWNAFVTGFANGTYSLPNARMKLRSDVSPGEFITTVLGSGGSDDIASDAYANVAESLAVDGAFNVNSTSVEAWKAVLSATNGLDVRYLNSSGGGQNTASDQDFPFSRMSLPNDTANHDWTGFRSLDEDEITDLAEAIVEQVKERGPFVSLADFVNRRLSGDETGLKGALQSAIDATSINHSFNDTVSTGELSAYNYPYAEHAAGDIAAGATGYLRQSDLLQTLGPVLSARSDTFVVRAYGDYVNELTNVTTKAWCEAVIQRMPDYVDAGNAPTDVGAALSQENQDFGRRFRIVRFRWLNENEV